MTTTHVHLSAGVTCAMRQGDHCQWLDITDAHGNGVVLFASDAHLVTLVSTITTFLLSQEARCHADADSAAAVSDGPTPVGAAHLSDHGGSGCHT